LNHIFISHHHGNEVSGYKHTGPVYDNGYVDTLQEITDYSLLKVVPGDDGFHLTDPVIGNFEWWYFDITDIQNNILLKIVAHIGTNPLKTRIFPQLAFSVITPEINENFTRAYAFDDFKGSTEKCQIQLKNEFEVRAEHHTQTEYFIMVNVPGYSAELHFTNEIEGWKPSGNRVRYRKAGRSADFMWIIPSPKAKVDGYFVYKGRRYNVQHATGYHDHNYCSVQKERPLHLDSLVKKWYWGKCYCEDYTLIFMDTFFRTKRLRSLFVARKDEIIHSSNNLASLKIENSGYDAALQTAYPSSLSVSLKEDAVSLKVFIESVKIIDKRDLLEGVPSLLKWMIKKFIVKPVYFGLFSKALLEMDGKITKGFGNYEYMAFRT